MAPSRPVRAGRPSRVVVHHHRRPAVPPTRPIVLNPRRRDRRTRGRSAGAVLARSGARVREMAPRPALGIEVVRAILEVTAVVLALLVALPALLELAAARLH